MHDNKVSVEKPDKNFKESQILAAELEKNCIEKLTRKPTGLYEPLPLQRESSPAKPYPFDALGPILGAAARRIHEVVQAPDATCGQSLLAALSLAVQGFVDVHVDGRMCPSSLFMLTVSESGERKTGVDKIALKPIYDWQKMLVKQHKNLMVEYKNKHDIWKCKRGAAIKLASDNPTDIGLVNLESEPQQPCEGLILCEEPTIEGLEQLLERGQPSAGVFSDEGGRLVGGHAMNADNALKTACGLSNLWDGKPLTRVRKSEGSKIYYGRRLSMHLMIQPIVLMKLLNNPILVGQGLLSRCLFSAPSPLAGTRKYREENLNKDKDIISYYDHINKILDSPSPKNNEQNDSTQGMDEGLTPIPVELNDEAKNRWKKFHDDIDRRMCVEGEFYPIKSFASKAAEQVLRIAGLFAFSESISLAGKPQINLQQIERAILLVEFYLSEALRTLGQCEVNQNIIIAQRTLEWIKNCYPNSIFPLSAVYQLGPAQVRNAKKAKEIMEILKEHDLVIEVVDTVINKKKVRSAWRLA